MNCMKFGHALFSRGQAGAHRIKRQEDLELQRDGSRRSGLSAQVGSKNVQRAHSIRDHCSDTRNFDSLNMTIPTYIDNSSILYAWNDLPCSSSVTVLNLHSDVICGSLAGKAASQLNSTYTPQVAS